MKEKIGQDQKENRQSKKIVFEETRNWSIVRINWSEEAKNWPDRKIYLPIEKNN